MPAPYSRFSSNNKCIPLNSVAFQNAEQLHQKSTFEPGRVLLSFTKMINLLPCYFSGNDVWKTNLPITVTNTMSVRSIRFCPLKTTCSSTESAQTKHCKQPRKSSIQRALNYLDSMATIKGNAWSKWKLKLLTSLTYSALLIPWKQK